MPDPKSQITQILEEIGDGRQSAEELLPLVYDELRSPWRRIRLRKGRPPPGDRARQRKS